MAKTLSMPIKLTAELQLPSIYLDTLLTWHLATKYKELCLYFKKSNKFL